MEHLTKQQITLVAILVSLVTSLATGIVTVSLMDQSNPGMTNTINRVVERTIERVVQPELATAVKPVETILTIIDSTEEAVAKADKASVKIVTKSNKNNVMGSGVVIDGKGTVAADISFLPLNNDYVILYQNGNESSFDATSTESKIKILYPRDVIDVKTINHIPPSNDSPKLGKSLVIIKKDSVSGATSVFNSIIETVLSSTTIKTSYAGFLEDGAYVVDLNGSLYAYKINDLILTNDLKKYIKK